MIQAMRYCPGPLFRPQTCLKLGEQFGLSSTRVKKGVVTTSSSSTLSQYYEKPVHCEDRRYNIALIGLGHRGYRTHFLSTVGSRSESIIAVCDTDDATLESFSVKHPEIPIYPSVVSLLQSHRPDFAVVCVPHKFHMDCVTTLSGAGIPVLKEKPAAGSPSEFRQMAGLPVKIGVAFQKRFEPRFVQFKKLLHLVGDIASFRAVLAMNIENLESTWRATDGVGVTEDFGCHILDLIIWLFGMPSSVAGHSVDSVRRFQKYGGDDVSNVIMHWRPSNIIGHIHISRVAHKWEESITVTGTSGTLCLDGNKVIHLDVDGRQTLEMVDMWTEKSIVRSMFRKFGDYVTGRVNDYPGSLANVRDTVTIVEATRRSFATLQVENLLPVPTKTPSPIPEKERVWPLTTSHSDAMDKQLHLRLPINTKRTFTLNTGAEMPAVGLGTRKPKQPNEVREVVKTALIAGYRHIDTAQSSFNEHEVAQGLKDSGISREETWITTKLANTWHHRVGEGIAASLKSLDTDYVDLYLMHWPSSTDPDDPKNSVPGWDFINTWQEMQKLPASGRVRNIGVSNFGIKNLERLLSDPSCNIVPAVNQIELHPYWPSPKLLAYCRERGIHCTAYSCLGSYDSPLYKDPTLLSLAEKKGKTPQQILIMWGLQRGNSVIPKSVIASRVEKNFDLDGWELSGQEMDKLSNLGVRFKACRDHWLPAKVFWGDDE